MAGDRGRADKPAQPGSRHDDRHLDRAITGAGGLTPGGRPEQLADPLCRSLNAGPVADPRPQGRSRRWLRRSMSCIAGHRLHDGGLVQTDEHLGGQSQEADEEHEPERRGQQACPRLAPAIRALADADVPPGRAQPLLPHSAASFTKAATQSFVLLVTSVMMPL